MMTNAELDKFLCETYPKMFGERNQPMQETCMCWGFEIGDGWSNILKVLCSQIQWHIDQSVKDNKYDIEYNDMVLDCKSGNWTKFDKLYSGTYTDEFRKNRHAELAQEEERDIREIVPQVVVGQVKEKFGSLRFYYSGGDEYINGLVSFAEGMTEVTCEECGNPGRNSTGGWLRVRCVDHGGVAEEDEVEPQ